MKKVSGSKTVFVPITRAGRNFLPDIEDLRDKYIKYIDFVPMNSIPDSNKPAISDNKTNLTMTLFARSGNIIVSENLPLDRYNINLNRGVRVPIMRKLNIFNSFINALDDTQIGKTVVLVFWYDTPSCSRCNRSNDTDINFFEIPIINGSGFNPFPDNRVMVDKRFRNFFVNFTNNLPSGGVSITEANTKDFYLTFRKGTFAVLDLIPLPLFFQLGLYEQLELANITFDFTNSFAKVGGLNNTASKNKLQKLL